MRVLSALFPFRGWFKEYSASSLRADFVAGMTVALVLVPQSMAYAQLAGLPAYYGLYAAFLPPLVGALFGSSQQLATGPVAVVSLMTAASLESLATAGSPGFIAYAMAIALIVGVFQFSLGALRLGLVVNFLSHPVVNGFTNAAALIIASSQLSNILGVRVQAGHHEYETVYRVVKAALSYTHWPSVALAAAAFAIMMVLKRTHPRVPSVLVAVAVTSVISWSIGFEHNAKVPIAGVGSPEVTQKIQMYNAAISVLDRKAGRSVALGEELTSARKTEGEKSADFVTLKAERDLLNVGASRLKEIAQKCRQELRDLAFRATRQDQQPARFFVAREFPKGLEDDGLTWRLQVSNGGIAEDGIGFTGGGAVVGHVPRGLPGVSFPHMTVSGLFDLLPMALIIALLGFMEAISIAKAMATKTGQTLDPNQELIGQGLANIVGSMTQGYPVSGSFSRSAVNLQAGALTGMSNVFSSGFVLLTLLFLTPLLYHLPQSVLAAIIMMAVLGLVNVRGFVHAWRAKWYDGAIAVITLACTLFFAPHLDIGIMIGVVLSIGLHLFRDMRPSIALLAMHTDGTYRNRERFKLAQCRHIAVIRYQGSLIFANVSYLEECVLDRVAAMPELKHILIVGNGINELDASGEDMLSVIVDRLIAAGYLVSFSGLNDSVMDTMRRTGLYHRIGDDHFHRNATRAIEAIWPGAHIGTTEASCPLLAPVEDRIAATGGLSTR